MKRDKNLCYLSTAVCFKNYIIFSATLSHLTGCFSVSKLIQIRVAFPIIFFSGKNPKKRLSALSSVISYFFKIAQINPIILSFSFGELSAVNKVNAVSAGGVMRLKSKIFACCKNQTNA